MGDYLSYLHPLLVIPKEKDGFFISCIIDGYESLTSMYDLIRVQNTAFYS